MIRFFLGLLFLAGLPVCMFVLPALWWPWSTFVWFFGFVALENGLFRLARRWRGRQLPSGVAGFGISIALAVDDAATAESSGDGGDSGDGGGGD